ncbi:hypothetical protein Q1695_004221 [Nippostrongylus brasiliensis]|nr:hypothetical protein Q1695_004221 [Nippostrongylus brasiliensis]
MLLVVATVAVLIVSRATPTNSRSPVPGVAPLLQCPGRDNSVQRGIVRHGLYQYFNYMRRGIASGVDMFKNGAFENNTRLMYAMKYDCDLEGNASKVLKSGGTLPHNQVGLRYESHKPGDEFLGAGEIRKALNEWKTNSLAQFMFLNPYVPLFGCAHSYENKQLKLICVFRIDTIEATNERFPPCQNHTDCKQYAKSTCHSKLCWAPFGL